MGQHFGATPFLIAGPCVVESDALNLRIGEALAELGTKLGVHVIYKASYDKANRSRLKGARGPGLERGLQALATVRSETGLPILTDVHDAAQVAAAAQVADVLQIPAFLCRQTDLLVAAGRAGRAVNVKKGQWLSPDGMQGAVEKVRAYGGGEPVVTERQLETFPAYAVEPLARGAYKPLGRWAPPRHRPSPHSAAPPSAAPAQWPAASGVQRDGPAAERGRPWVADV